MDNGGETEDARFTNRESERFVQVLRKVRDEEHAGELVEERVEPDHQNDFVGKNRLNAK